MYHTNGEGEGEVETKSKELWAETPRETSEIQGEKDSESLDSEDLYLDTPRTDDTTNGGKLPLEEFQHSFVGLQEKKKFRKSSVFVIVLLFIGLGVLTYMVLDLKAKLKDKNALEKELNEKDIFMNEQLVGKNEALDELKKKNEEMSQQLVEKNEALDELKKKNEKLSHLKFSAISSVARTGNVEVLKAMTDDLDDNIELDYLEIVRILEVAANNKHFEVMAYIFGRFLKSIPMDLEYRPEKDKFESMYSELKNFLFKIPGFAPQKIERKNHVDNPIVAYFKMYGPFIVSYERYLYRIRGFSSEWMSMFDEAIQKFMSFVNIACMGLIQDIQKENISDQYTNEDEKDYIKEHIRQRAQRGLEYFKSFANPERIKLYELLLIDEDQEQALA